MRFQKPYETRPYKARNVETLRSISNQPQWLDLLFGMNKPYEKLLSHIQLLCKLMDDEKPVDRSIKGISAAINEKTANVTKWIPQIYDELYLLNQKQPEHFKSPGIRYDLFFNSAYHPSAYFTLWLNTTVNLYDNFSFEFIEAKIGSSIFWVESVNHNYVYGEQTIYLVLNSGTRNRYREFIIDQADFQNMLGYFDRLGLSEFQLDDKLRELFPRYRNR